MVIFASHALVSDPIGSLIDGRYQAFGNPRTQVSLRQRIIDGYGVQGASTRVVNATNLNKQSVLPKRLLQQLSLAQQLI
jgi:hypothetical protein